MSEHVWGTSRCQDGPGGDHLSHGILAKALPGRDTDNHFHQLLRYGNEETNSQWDKVSFLWDTACVTLVSHEQGQIVILTSHKLHRETVHIPVLHYKLFRPTEGTIWASVEKSSEARGPGIETQFQKVTLIQGSLVWNVKGVLAYFLQGFVVNKYR